MNFAKLDTGFLEQLAPHFRPPNCIVVTGLPNTGKSCVVRTLAHEATRYLMSHQLAVYDDWRPSVTGLDGHIAVAARELNRLWADAVGAHKLVIIGIAQNRPPMRAREGVKPLPPILNLAYGNEPSYMAGLLLYTERNDAGEFRLEVLKDRYAKPGTRVDFTVSSTKLPWDVLAAPR